MSLSNILKTLFSFQGRIGRATFWAAYISISMMMGFIMGLADVVAGEDAGDIVSVAASRGKANFLPETLAQSTPKTSKVSV